MTALIWAMFVATTLWFPFRRGSLGFGIFVVTMAFNEIPLVLLMVFAASLIALLGGTGAEGGAAVAVALVVSCIVTLGLVWLQVRARSVPPTLEASLSAGLGADWRASVGPEFGPAAELPAPWGRGILLPLQRHVSSVQRVRNVPYAPGGRAHLLDIYRRKDRTSLTDLAVGRPVLVHLHGGGFVRGGKSREGVMLLNQLVDHGWLCVSANYGLRSRGAFPESLVDTKRVIAWVRAHAVELGADPDQIFLAGGSAGGHLAISAALTARDPRYQPGFAEADTSVAGAVALYGYLGPRSSDPASSPAGLARPDAPPIMIVHGARDTAIPPPGPRSVAATLRATSNIASRIRRAARHTAQLRPLRLRTRPGRRERRRSVPRLGSVPTPNQSRRPRRRSRVGDVDPLGPQEERSQVEAPHGTNLTG